MTITSRRVINSTGDYVTTVLVTIEESTKTETILALYGRPTYILKPGERLADLPAPPAGLVKPRWDGYGWIESATAEEIAQALQKRDPVLDYTSVPDEPAAADQIADLKQQMINTQLALAEMREQTDRQNTDVMLALAEVYEKTLENGEATA